MAEHVSITASAVQSPGHVIDRDLYCVQCGYNLRGLVQSGACPECAAAVARSLDPQTLINADRRWVRQLRWGIWLLLAASVTGAVAGSVGIAPSVIRAAAFGSPVAYKLPTPAAMAFAWTGLWDAPRAGIEIGTLALSATLVVCGAWLLTRRWPWPGSEPALKRRAVRLGCAIAAVVLLLSVFIPTFFSELFIWTTWSAIQYYGDPFIQVLDFALGALILAYLGDLSARVPDARLPIWFRCLAWLLVVVGAVVVVPRGYELIMQRAIGDRFRSVAGLIFVGLLLVHSTLLLWTLFRFQRRLSP